MIQKQSEGKNQTKEPHTVRIAPSYFYLTEQLFDLTDIFVRHYQITITKQNRQNVDTNTCITQVIQKLDKSEQSLTTPSDTLMDKYVDIN